MEASWQIASLSAIPARRIEKKTELTTDGVKKKEIKAKQTWQPRHYWGVRGANQHQAPKRRAHLLAGSTHPPFSVRRNYCASAATGGPAGVDVRIAPSALSVRRRGWHGWGRADANFPTELGGPASTQTQKPARGRPGAVTCNFAQLSTGTGVHRASRSVVMKEGRSNNPDPCR